MLKSLSFPGIPVVISTCLLTQVILLNATPAVPKPAPSSVEANQPVCFMQGKNGSLYDLSALCQQDQRQQSGVLQQLLSTRQCSGCNLQGANLVGAKLREANLSRANLSQSQMTNAFLPFTDLSGATLSQADLKGANLTGANLMGANLAGANLKGAELSGASLEGANLTRTIMPDGSVHP